MPANLINFSHPTAPSHRHNTLLHFLDSKSQRELNKRLSVFRRAVCWQLHAGGQGESEYDAKKGHPPMALLLMGRCPTLLAVASHMQAG
jgi:hypothetical protein